MRRSFPVTDKFSLPKPLSAGHIASTWSSDTVTGFGGLLFCSELFFLQELKSSSQAAMQGGGSACAAWWVLYLQGHDVAYSWESLHPQPWLKAVRPKGAEYLSKLDQYCQLTASGIIASMLTKLQAHSELHSFSFFEHNSELKSYIYPTSTLLPSPFFSLFSS